jgi:NitT/TauT family transport system ATP-binding protein
VDRQVGGVTTIANAGGHAAAARDDAGMLEFDAASKTYQSGRGTVEALQAVSFGVRRGEFVSILGRSGCGKSTLLKLAAGLTPASGGAIRIGGEVVTRPVEGLGMVFQTPVLLEWRDVLANIVLPLEILHSDRRDGLTRARELVRMVGLGGFEHRYPNELSGGMQQRVAICRALIIDPALLLMDEPFGALDALTRDEMGTELLRIWNATRKTIVFVTHSIDEAVLLSDRVVVLTERPGRVRTIVDIDLPRPRTPEVRVDPRFAEYGQILRRAVYRRTE